MPKRIPTKIKVIRFKTQNPFMRTSEIAKRMGYHRSYIYKILKGNGLPTKELLNIVGLRTKVDLLKDTVIDKTMFY